MHSLNIYIHVAAGILALLSGFIALNSVVGSPIHVRSGKIYLSLLCFVILTGLIGIIFFNVNHFLIVITILSGYQGFSGYRIVLHKNNQFKMLDIFITLLTLTSAVYYIIRMNNIEVIWSPVIIYGTLGYLFCIILYDFGRYFISEIKYKNIWIYEHIVKLTGSYFAIFSAFVGTVFPKWQPFSQIIPSGLGVIIMLYFVLRQIKSKNM